MPGERSHQSTLAGLTMVFCLICLSGISSAAAAATAAAAAASYITADVLIAGAGAGGTAAAIGAARMGAQVVLVEETAWLGGQNTAAGVSGFDGNKNNLSTGIYAEYKQRIGAAYGAAFRSNCTVSDFCFEPKVAATVLDTWVAEYKNIRVYRNTALVSVHKDGQRVLGATFREQNGNTLTVQAAVTIDGTEWGDVLAAAAAPFRLGRDSRSETLEPSAPTEAEPYVQDITFVTILKDYGAKADKTIAKPAGYRKEEFMCSVDTVCPKGAWDMGDWRPAYTEKEFFNYGRLPNGKFLINWPIHAANIEVGMDFYNLDGRQKYIDIAKQKALRFVYFIQTELGYKNLGLADDEFPTADNMPIYPYVRESRRMVGEVTLTANDVYYPFARNDRPTYQHSVAVISYWFDHHHTLRPPGFEAAAPRPPAFGIPLGSFISKSMDGLMAVDKNISVTHTVNGATRLAPAAFYGGAAAGVAAALAAKYQAEPRQVPVRMVQDILISWGTMLMPFQDLPASHPYFKQIQRVALAGVMVGDWPTNTEPGQLPIFAPNEKVSVRQGAIFVARALGLLPMSPSADLTDDDPLPYLAPYGITIDNPQATLTGEIFISWLECLPRALQSGKSGRDYELKALPILGELTKARLAAALDRCFDTFYNMPPRPIADILPAGL